MPDPGLREQHTTTRDLGYGRLDIAERTDVRSGSVLYRLYAPHVRGWAVPGDLGGRPHDAQLSERRETALRALTAVAAAERRVRALHALLTA